MEDRQKIMDQVTAWMKDQTDHVWRAMAGDAVLDPAGRQLRTRHDGKTVLYEFWYRGSCLAEARSSFSDQEKQWKFELVWVEPERYPQVKAYYNRRKIS